MSIQQTMKRSDAVCATVKGAGRYDFNPWERYEDDAGYCLDAPTQILAGSHVHYRDGVAFCTLVNRI